MADRPLDDPECLRAQRKLQRKLEEFERAYAEFQEKCSLEALQRRLRQEVEQNRDRMPVPPPVPPPPPSSAGSSAPVFDNEGVEVPEAGGGVASIRPPFVETVQSDDDDTPVTPPVAPPVAQIGSDVDDVSSFGSSASSIRPQPRPRPRPAPPVAPVRPPLAPLPVPVANVADVAPVPLAPANASVMSVHDPDGTVVDDDSMYTYITVDGSNYVVNRRPRPREDDASGNPAPPRRQRLDQNDPAFDTHPVPDPNDPQFDDWWRLVCAYCQLRRQMAPGLDLPNPPPPPPSIASSSSSSSSLPPPPPPAAPARPVPSYRERVETANREQMLEERVRYYESLFPSRAVGSVRSQNTPYQYPYWDTGSYQGGNYNYVPPPVPSPPGSVISANTLPSRQFYRDPADELERLRNEHMFEEESIYFDDPSVQPSVQPKRVRTDVSLDSSGRTTKRPKAGSPDSSVDLDYPGVFASTRSNPIPLNVRTRAMGPSDDLSLPSDISESSSRVNIPQNGVRVEMDSVEYAPYPPFAPVPPLPPSVRGRRPTSVVDSVEYIPVGGASVGVCSVQSDGSVITDEDVYQGLNNLLVWACKPMKAYRVSRDGFEGGEPPRNPTVDIGTKNIWNPTGTLGVGGLYLLRFSGHSETDPGVAGAGAVLYDVDGEEYWFGFKKLGDAVTQSIADYCSMIYGLKAASSLGVKNLVLEGNSNLVIKQMNGTWKVQNELLKKFYVCIQKWVAKFDYVEVRYVKEATNKRARWLAKNANTFS